MTPHPAPVLIRQATPADAVAAGEICYRAFSSINAAHNFPCDFPDPHHAIGLMQMMFSHAAIYCVVAESEGRILGSNCLDERSPIRGVGPITVDPETQNHGVGRRLMQAVMDRARERNAPGVRLIQAAFHNRSLSLYASLGYDVREPLSCMQGRTRDRAIPGCTVRPAAASDLDACNALARRVHGFDRAGELAEAVEHGTAQVVERAGQITGYATSLAFFGHGAAETNPDLQALLAAVDSFGGPGILIPTRNSALFQWCLAQGLRVVQPMTLMTTGLYSEPKGSWFPSILY